MENTLAITITHPAKSVVSRLMMIRADINATGALLSRAEPAFIHSATRRKARILRSLLPDLEKDISSASLAMYSYEISRDHISIAFSALRELDSRLDGITLAHIGQYLLNIADHVAEAAFLAWISTTEGDAESSRRSRFG